MLGVDWWIGAARAHAAVACAQKIGSWLCARAGHTIRGHGGGPIGVRPARGRRKIFTPCCQMAPV
eukprot:SAG25_NODE_1371_length_3186_cov_115.281503_1_plen_65_part_00